MHANLIGGKYVGDKGNFEENFNLFVPLTPSEKPEDKCEQEYKFSDIF